MELQYASTFLTRTIFLVCILLTGPICYLLQNNKDNSEEMGDDEDDATLEESFLFTDIKVTSMVSTFLKAGYKKLLFNTCRPPEISKCKVTFCKVHIYINKFTYVYNLKWDFNEVLQFHKILWRT